MCEMASELTEIILINLEQSRIFMALAERVAGVGVIERLGAHALEVHEVAHAGGLDRLSAAVYAAARACHNFDELIVFLTALNHIKKLSGI